MNNVHTEYKRNAKSGFLHGYLLIPAYLRSALDIKQTSYLTIYDTFVDIHALSLTGNDRPGHREVQLAYLLVDSHLLHKSVDEAVHLLVRTLVYRTSGAHKH